MTPATPIGPVAVADQQHLGVEFAVDAVERDELFAGLRAADDDALAAHGIVVEGVQRLAGFEHHVVRDVDDVVDRPHAQTDESLLHPRRGRTNGYALR